MALVHIHAPQPDSVKLLRIVCPTCNKRRWMVSTHTPYYGFDLICLGCGERWQEGEMAERPFAPRWREKRKEEARAIYRRFKGTHGHA